MNYFALDGINSRKTIFNQIIQNSWEARHKTARNKLSKKKKSRLPLARIRRLIKCEENVNIVTHEVPQLLALATEAFIEDITLRAFVMTKDSQRKIVNSNDIVHAVKTSSSYDFLHYIINEFNHRYDK